MLCHYVCNGVGVFGCVLCGTHALEHACVTVCAVWVCLHWSVCVCLCVGMHAVACVHVKLCMLCGMHWSVHVKLCVLCGCTYTGVHVCGCV